MRSTAGTTSRRAGFRTLLQAGLELGPRQICLFLSYRVALWSGTLRRRTPVSTWQQVPLAAWLHPGVPDTPVAYLAYRRQQSERVRFLFDPEADLFPPLEEALGRHREALLREAEEILEGRFRLFGGPPVALGFPPDWGAFAPRMEGEPAARVDLDHHWTAYEPESLPCDAKLLWEASRFGWVFPLARAYRLTGENRFAEACWQLVEDWSSANLPNAGPHWLSGQEVALRILALTFALYALWPALAERPERLVRLAQMVAVHAARLPVTLAYAQSLDNNHLVSEAAGLLTAGLIFPEFRQSPRWRALGRRWLISAISRQIFPDGGQVQHSMNYHRMVLQAGLWSARLAERNGEPLPSTTMDGLRRAARFEARLADDDTGQVPNLGPNDGGLILPLTTCTVHDYRPTLGMAAAVWGEPALLHGPWDEACVWLGLARRPHDREETFPAAPATADDAFPQSGLYVLRGRRARAVLRCARFSARPGHSDQLHIDLVWHGQRIACDAGSFRYRAPTPWDDALSAACVHNTLLLDGQEPMRRAGRFLWLNWAQGHFLGRWSSPGGEIEVLCAEHDGYRRFQVTHRRTIARAGDNAWLIADDLLGRGQHEARLHWLLPDWPSPQLAGDELRLGTGDTHLIATAAAHREAVEVPTVRHALYRAGALVAGERLNGTVPVWGWWSPTYTVRLPALSWVNELSGWLPMRLVTIFCLGGARPEDLGLTWRQPGTGVAALERIAFASDHLDLPSSPPRKADRGGA
jgi:hypothetical protein